MGVAVLNALIAVGVALGHFCANHSTTLLFIGFFAAIKAPAKIPVTPQDLWTWGRDTAQAIAETRSLPHPTQPAPTVPGDKPTA